MTTRTCDRGFTLIEVLVVIAVISLIIAILLPALGAARREARATPCAANLKSVGQAMGSYLVDSRSYPASYVYGAQREGPTWNTQDQAGSHPQPLNGYVHWSFTLLGDGQRVPESAFRCPAAPRGGAPATNPGPDPGAWETGQTNNVGGTTPGTGPQDRQASRMAYVANAAVMPRNKFVTAARRRNRLVGDGDISFGDRTILATELVHTNSWRTVFDGTVSRSHRPITPFLGLTKGDDVYDEPDAPGGASFRYPASSTVLRKDQLREDMLGFGRNPINAVGRSHPGGVGWIGGSANFVFVDGHVERMTLLASMERRLWGDRFYSLTGGATKVGP